MPQQHIPLPVETALRLQIARLTYEQAQLHARLLQQERDMLLASAAQVFQTSIMAILGASGVDLPVPWDRCTFDVEHGCLVYEADETALPP